MYTLAERKTTKYRFVLFSGKMRIIARVFEMFKQITVTESIKVRGREISASYLYLSNYWFVWFWSLFLFLYHGDIFVCLFAWGFVFFSILSQKLLVAFQHIAELPFKQKKNPAIEIYEELLCANSKTSP